MQQAATPIARVMPLAALMLAPGGAAQPLIIVLLPGRYWLSASATVRAREASRTLKAHGGHGGFSNSASPMPGGFQATNPTKSSAHSAYKASVRWPCARINRDAAMITLPNLLNGMLAFVKSITTYRGAVRSDERPAAGLQLRRAVVNHVAVNFRTAVYAL
jgi:hypothetical protein